MKIYTRKSFPFFFHLGSVEGKTLIMMRSRDLGKKIPVSRWDVHPWKLRKKKLNDPLVSIYILMWKIMK